jgi:hypothetical protein
MLYRAKQQQQQSFNDSYTSLILEEAEKLYNKLTTELTNRAIAAADIRASSLPLPPSANNVHNLAHNDEIEEPRHNNESEIYNNDQ